MAQQIKDLDLTVPAIMLKGHGKEVEVKANGQAKSTGVIYLPKRFIDKKYFMILIPKDDEIIENLNTRINI